MGTTAKILKTGGALLMIPGEPLIARLGTDPVGMAQGSKIPVL
jgi:hypothetical protein